MQYMICIENLFPHVYVAEICKVFEKYGNILSARVEFIKGLNKGYVTFDNFSSAQFAIKEMNGRNILGKPMLLKFETHEELNSKKNATYTKVFVKNVDTNWDDCDFIRLFSKFGEVTDAKVFESSGKSKGSGFVEFESHKSAKKAVQAMNHQLINDKKIIVEPYESKPLMVFNPFTPTTVEAAKDMLEKSTQLNNLHIKNLPKDTTEDELRILFQPFGKVESIKIAMDDKNMSKGFGFVCFSNAKDAGLAREKINKCEYKSKILEVNFNQKKEVRQQYLRAVNTDEKVRKFTKEQESLQMKSNKNTMLSFSGKKK